MTASSHPQDVYANIYDASRRSTIANLNDVLYSSVGMGAFHVGVQVYGKEWSYGRSDEDSGVRFSPPGMHPHHTFREQVYLGPTRYTPDELRSLIIAMQNQWQGPDYDVLVHNCCHFAEALVDELGVSRIPQWACQLHKCIKSMVGYFTGLFEAVGDLNKGVSELIEGIGLGSYCVIVGDDNASPSVWESLWSM
eukprot:GEMP01021737.1.p1 GENE.GEMP01021737.1~~GEMP01021737.1.p1  ORF type:complete len:194 (+),score=32.02 GEMP01021737.1:181-762(+)